MGVAACCIFGQGAYVAQGSLCSMFGCAGGVKEAGRGKSRCTCIHTHTHSQELPTIIAGSRIPS